jgi:glycosyltransferase involved in cell wall biosynthesis
MTSLVFVTQLVDPNDPALGFTMAWIDALAERASAMTVIANEVRHEADGHLNVWSLGKEDGASRVARTLSYEKALMKAPAGSAVFAHMCPSYLVAAAPIAMARRMRRLLWFAHPSQTAMLALAEHGADVVLTSLPGSYPRNTSKVRIIGQAIDTTRLRFRATRMDPCAPRLVTVGRTSRSKGFHIAIRALRRLRNEGIAATLRIVGPSTTEAERRHRDELAALATELGVSDAVSIIGGVPPCDVAAQIAEADVLVNAMVAGSGDKVVFEALALGRPVVASNPAFATLLDGTGVRMRFRPDDPDDLAHRIASIGRGDIASALRTLRMRVEREHSLDHWADAVMEAAR